MKLKEVCRRTGLSRKTIRLYEEKELLVPRKEVRNGREYREYTEEDVQTLLVVASLRKAWFTMEEIRRMQRDPAAIAEILPQYRQWLYAQKRQLDGLIAAAEKLAAKDIHSVAELSAQIQAETDKLPLPPMDVTPHFRYLDELEERLPLEVDEQQKQREERQKERAWAWRRIVLYSSKLPFFDYNFQRRLFRESRNLDWKGNDGPVQRVPPEQGPRWLRRVKGFLTLTATVFAVMCMVRMLGGMFPLKLWVPFLLTAGVRLAMAGVDYRREQRAWLRRLQGEDNSPKN